MASGELFDNLAFKIAEILFTVLAINPFGGFADSTLHEGVQIDEGTQKPCRNAFADSGFSAARHTNQDNIGGFAANVAQDRARRTKRQRPTGKEFHRLACDNDAQSQSGAGFKAALLRFPDEPRAHRFINGVQYRFEFREALENFCRFNRHLIGVGGSAEVGGVKEQAEALCAFDTLCGIG